jgi:hypothetical protein
MDVLAEVARALLYEGYILWPYRRSALKNRQRWTFGGVYPPAFSAASSGVDRSRVTAQCLVEASEHSRLDVTLRFLHVVSRQALQGKAGEWRAVDHVTVDDSTVLSWDEAAERELAMSLPLSAVGGMSRAPIVVEPGMSREELRAADGTIAGAIERRWESLRGEITVAVEPRGRELPLRVTVCITNSSPFDSLGREEAIRRTFVSAHAALHVNNGAFVSMLEPPVAFAAEVAACRQVGLWPVLLGEEGSRDTMLASPIILYDYPRIAPESPGDFFDGGEIDQLLILNTLSMTDDEKREMYGTDPKVRQILERCAAMSPDALSGLHGAIRSFRPVDRAE